MSKRTVHIAGLGVTVGVHTRQRCDWCGELLFEFDAARSEVEPGVTFEEASKGYPTGALVEVEGRNPRVSVVLEHKDGDQLPAGFCGDDEPRIVAVPDVTTP